MENLNKLELALLLSEKQRRMGNDPLRYSQMSRKQQEATKASRPIRALFWGNRVGKTEWGAQEITRYLLGQHPYRSIDTPIEVWAACPSYDQQKETTQKKLEHYIPKNRIKDVTYVKKNTWGEIVLDNGSKINFKSYEQGREKFQGVGKRLIWFDEEPAHDIWEECFVRTEAGVPLDIILTMTPINGMCFDEETKILSPRGWLGIDDIKKGENIFTVNKETLKVESKVADFIYKGVTDKKMVSLKCQGFDALVTEDHRWFVKSKRTGKYEIRQTKDLKKHLAIPRTVASSYNPVSNYEDWYTQLIGWVVTDGTYRIDRSQVIITQSWSYNKEKCLEIESILNDSKCNYRKNINIYHKGEPSQGESRSYTIKGRLAKRIIKEFPTKELTVEFVSSISGIQRKLLFNSLIKGDGSYDGHSCRFVACEKYKGTVFALMAICQLMGIRSTYYKDGEGFYRVYIQYGGKRYKPFTHVCNLSINKVKYNKRIWCPHTENETVIAMRNGTSYISMNTWTYDDLYLATGNEDIFTSTAGWDDNPWLNEKQKEQMERGLTAESLQVRKFGKFVKRIGLVCDWWMRDKHLVDMSNTDFSEMKIYRTADFGYSAYNAVAYIAVDKYENWYVMDGFYERGLTTDEIAEKIAEHDKGKFIADAWGDAAAAQVLADLRKKGIHFRPVRKRPEGGMEDWDEYRAQVMAAHGKVDRATRQPKLFISDRLIHFDEKLGKEVNWAVQEIEGLRWAENKVTGRDKETKPRWGDQAKHFVDALSYFAVTQELPGISYASIKFKASEQPYIEETGSQWDKKEKEEIVDWQHAADMEIVKNQKKGLPK